MWNRPKRINDSYTLEQANSSLTSLAKLFHFTCRIGSASVCAAVFWPCAPVCHCVASPSPLTNPRLSLGLPHGTWGNSSPNCVCGCAHGRVWSSLRGYQACAFSLVTWPVPVLGDLDEAPSLVEQGLRKREEIAVLEGHKGWKWNRMMRPSA